MTTLIPGYVMPPKKRKGKTPSKPPSGPTPIPRGKFTFKSKKGPINKVRKKSPKNRMMFSSGGKAVKNSMKKAKPC